MDRVDQLEVVLAGLIDHIDHVGCYERGGVRLDYQVSPVKQARMVLGQISYDGFVTAPVVLPVLDGYIVGLFRAYLTPERDGRCGCALPPD